MKIPAIDPEMTYQKRRNIVRGGWDSYFERRQFTNSSDRKEAVVRFLSEYLTFPLTLARHVHDSVDLDADNSNSETIDLAIDVVGARAEASLPIWIWRELLWLLLPEATDHGSTAQISIRLIGPQVEVRPPLLIQGPPMANEQSAQQPHTLRIDFIPSFYHTLVNEETPRQRSPNLVCLFNPGLHSHESRSVVTGRGGNFKFDVFDKNNRLDTRYVPQPAV